MSGSSSTMNTLFSFGLDIGDSFACRARAERGGRIAL
jgi:hypothetical protein